MPVCDGLMWSMFKNSPILNLKPFALRLDLNVVITLVLLAFIFISKQNSPLCKASCRPTFSFNTISYHCFQNKPKICVFVMQNVSSNLFSNLRPQLIFLCKPYTDLFFNVCLAAWCRIHSCRRNCKKKFKRKASSLQCLQLTASKTKCDETSGSSVRTTLGK